MSQISRFDLRHKLVSARVLMEYTHMWLILVMHKPKGGGRDNALSGHLFQHWSIIV